jgi:four helix bundle protein
LIRYTPVVESAPMTASTPHPSRFDLEERTAKFGSAVILFAKTIPDTPVARPLIPQLVRAATSIGANYCEAHETKHWLRMVAVAAPELRAESRTLWREARELNLIFNAIMRKTRAKSADDAL